MAIRLVEIKEAAETALIKASTEFRPDQQLAYEHALRNEANPQARWVLEAILENAAIATEKKFPLCDDTGVPHVFVEIGRAVEVDGGIGDLLLAVNDGVVSALRCLPGRPMAVKGDGCERIAQTKGLYEDPGMLEPAPISIRIIPAQEIRISVLMLGGGPEIRSRTFRVFHHHQTDTVIGEVARWGAEAAGELGCTPCVPAVGIGRTHYEATNLMLEAMKDASFDVQSSLERAITDTINSTHVGALGLGGSITALASFVKVGPQRASGVRIVCLRVGCCFDPRRATVTIAQ